MTGAPRVVKRRFIQLWRSLYVTFVSFYSSSSSSSLASVRSKDEKMNKHFQVFEKNAARESDDPFFWIWQTLIHFFYKVPAVSRREKECIVYAKTHVVRACFPLYMKSDSNVCHEKVNNYKVSRNKNSVTRSNYIKNRSLLCSMFLTYFPIVFSKVHPEKISLVLQR